MALFSLYFSVFIFLMDWNIYHFHFGALKHPTTLGALYSQSVFDALNGSVLSSAVSVSVSFLAPSGLCYLRLILGFLG